MFVSYVETPLGLVEIEANAHGLTALRFVEAAPEAVQGNGISEAAATQLIDYFAGARRDFSVPLAMQGTEFQQGVWRALTEIPYGQTISYQQLAVRLGQPHGAQAVGAANGQNPIAIIVPCHRVLGKDGALIGYAGGLHRKAWLLRHEGALLL
ncbi:MAG: methylated-DNA--[protein]-cysteine S-methyltransferase [Anaerolineales bacterium]|nr:methylated-DNA--[protein]-cysteine S-methyltransferase [Anaerolineales bacterium]MCB9128102.1 methylated-DNA--[protein]-cysteine S-methyltransferase [Ardenticatenales bacterium]MCB9171815.1 methylated-DNA--[protein]-cysteine S-methyltransferase [Ardenticatenales bacterium]